ncbi:MAG: MaoC family dehydratase [Sutterellaceae bacterium]|nr:MaoC family dehydratase [Burkholderiaceae bacterium]MCX7902635.1 MaoC family dehydratase [Burkholderiaceae bacterium]MDW8430974.1 MaoC family dehydratase [Sutterellaceae bacterium]
MQGPLKTIEKSALAALVGREVGTSSWIKIDQARIAAFADVTEDHMFLHVDPVRAAATPFGTTIAHGFLTLSLLSRMAYEVCPAIAGSRFGVNYGCNRLRFVAPVKNGARVRGRFLLRGLQEQPGDRLLATYDVTVEIEGEEKPALVIEWLTMTFL